MLTSTDVTLVCYIKRSINYADVVMIALRKKKQKNLRMRLDQVHAFHATLGHGAQSRSHNHVALRDAFCAYSARKLESILQDEMSSARIKILFLLFA